MNADVGGGYSFALAEDQGKLRVKITFAKNEDATGEAPPVSLEWNEKKLVMETVK